VSYHQSKSHLFVDSHNLLSSEHDQELDSLLVGPIPVGVNKFIFEADPPSLTKLPSSEILGVTVILLTCSYDSREFVRVGYYVNNEYDDELLAADPPSKPVIDKLRRVILADKPRVTRFGIKWDSEESAPAEFPPEQPEADQAEDDEVNYGADELEEEEKAEAGEGEKVPVEGEDAEMEGVETEGAEEKTAEDDAASDAGSEDLEAESSGSEDEEEEEEEGEGDEEMDMGEDKPAAAASGVAPGKPKQVQQQTPDVMVH
jgi:histone chaperone ASF1